ncbi:MAG TPA: long-chain-fatty-acid--CoA ligase [Steroidobacteraceae bacterium]|nr:long-chain-fatty-acid--CoA ligase [Steroidobacteraceae bacterium]
MYVTQCLHRTLQQKPEGIATRSATRAHTFRELADRVARLAAGLCALGMRAGDRVAILALNSERHLECQLAVLWGGGVLNPCNIRWSVPELVYCLNDCQSSLLIVDPAFARLVEALRSEAPSIRSVIHAGEGEAPGGMIACEELIDTQAPAPDALRSGSDLAGIFYTGGTTGFPKGVMLSHTNLCSSALAALAEGLAPPASTYLHAAPMFHLADLGFSMAHLARGNTHSFVEVYKPEHVLERIERERVTHTLLVPTMIQRLIEHIAVAPPRDLSSLKLLLYGAAPMSEALLDAAIEALPHVQLLQVYGMTELAPLATANLPDSYGPSGRARGRHRAAGRAGLCMDLRIADAFDQPVPRGTVGEVLVRGPNVMLGYWGKPAETEQALRGGWMHTGDAGYLDEEGFLYLVDRLKDMIISGGENIYSAEVENALAEHAGVAQCAVIGVPDREWGERVHAIVVPTSGAAPTVEDLIEHCRSLIAAYKCPRSIEFTDALPLSAAGKVLKAELRRRARGAAA